MITELSKAIIARWESASGAAVRALVGETDTVKKLWEDEAPQSLSDPYVTFSVPAAGIQWSMAEDLDQPRVQFDVWSEEKSSSVAKQIADALKDLFNNVNLPMTNGYEMIRSDPIAPGWKVFNTEDKGYRVIVEFDFILEKTR